MSETALQARIDDLEEQVRYWRDIATENTSTATRGAIAAALGLSAAEAWIVAALYRARGRVVSRVMLNEQHPGKKRGDERESDSSAVYVCRIRARLGTSFIITQRDLGYRLSPEAIARIDSITGDIQCSASS